MKRLSNGQRSKKYPNPRPLDTSNRCVTLTIHITTVDGDDYEYKY